MIATVPARLLACCLAFCLSNGASAQEYVSIGTGANLRGLDKLTGQVTDMPLENGKSTTIGRLNVELTECRYPVDDPSADAFAFLTIREDQDTPVLFKGWMIASSPALNALEHPRYDVWVIRCNTPPGAKDSDTADTEAD